MASDKRNGEVSNMDGWKTGKKEKKKKRINMQLQLACYTDLLLKSNDVANAAINGIPSPSHSFITKRNNSIKPLVRRYSGEKLRGIASAKYLVHCCKVSGALICVKIWCKYAPFYALSPKKFASATRPTSVVFTHHHLILMIYRSLLSSSQDYFAFLVGSRKSE